MTTTITLLALIVCFASIRHRVKSRAVEKRIKSSTPIAETPPPIPVMPPPIPAESPQKKTIHDYIRIEHEGADRCSVYLKDDVSHLESIYFNGLEFRYQTDYRVHSNEVIFKIRDSREGRYEFIADHDGIVSTCFNSSMFGVPSGLKVGQKLIEINYNAEYFAGYDEMVARRNEKAAEERNRQSIEKERKEVADKLREKERKRKLERDVLRELIINGEIMPPEGREPIPRDVVNTIFIRDGGRCVYCGSMQKLHIDHIVPLSKGGSDTLENLQVLCRECNIKKSNKIG